MGLKRCCCCYNLKDGSHAIAITLLFLTSLGLLVRIGTFAILRSHLTGENNQRIDAQEVVLFTLQVLLQIGCLVFNGLLVQGVETNSRGMVLAWLIFHAISFGLTSVGMVIIFILACVYGLGVLFGTALLLGVCLAVLWYWFAVVIAYYQQTSDGFVCMQHDTHLEKV